MGWPKAPAPRTCFWSGHLYGEENHWNTKEKWKIRVVRGADGQRGNAEFAPIVALSMARKIIEIPEENEGRICVVRGADEQRGIAELEPRVALRMGRKIIEIPIENAGFGWSGGWRTARNRRIWLPSVRGGKSLKFQRKRKDLRSQRGLTNSAESQNWSLE